MRKDYIIKNLLVSIVFLLFISTVMVIQLFVEFRKEVYFILLITIIIIDCIAILFISRLINKIKRIETSHGIKPFVYYSNYENCEDIESRISKHTGKDAKSIEINNKFFSSYWIFSTLFTDYRILLLPVDDFDKKSYTAIKKECNQKINKEESISQEIPLSKISRLARINIIFAKAMNQELEKIINADADFLFGRVEPILNVVICDRRIYIPRHTGISRYGKYYRVASFIRRTLCDE